jgi:hypothetical protein
MVIVNNITIWVNYNNNKIIKLKNRQSNKILTNDIFYFYYILDITIII